MALAGLFFGALAALSCFGWGRVAAGIGRSPLAWPVVTVFGLAVVVTLGGLLNAMGWAFGWALDGVAVIGLGLAAWSLWKDRPQADQWGWLGLGLALALVPAAFTAATLLPTTLFDFLDDFSKYLAYPVRMLATGSLAGSTLNSMGWETLGGQAFLDGFVLAHAPLTAINGVDAVFGLMLCGLLLAGSAQKGLGSLALVAIGVTVIALVPNHYVNISTLYLGTAVVMALVLVLTGTTDGLPSPVVAAVLAAALIAMKISFAPLVILGLLLATIGFLATDGWRRGLVWAAQALGVGVLALAPWLATYRGNLLAWLTGSGGLTEATVTQAAPAADPLAILSFKDLPYGGSYGAFSVLLITALAVALGLAWVSWRLGTPAGRRRAVAVAAMATALTVVTIAQLEYTLPRDFGHFTLRYAIPSVLGVLLAELALLASPQDSGLNRVVRMALAALVAVVPLGLFAGGAAPRLAQMADGKSMLAFHWLVDRPDFQAFSTAMVLPDASFRLQAIQDKVPAGEPLLAWVTTPFQLDYARNPVFDADYSGLATPWARLPTAHWVLWEVKGWAVAGHESYRKDAASPMDYVARQGRRAMVMAARLENAANHSHVVYFDGRYVVFDLAQPLDSFASALIPRP